MYNKDVIMKWSDDDVQNYLSIFRQTVELYLLEEYEIDLDQIQLKYLTVINGIMIDSFASFVNVPNTAVQIRDFLRTQMPLENQK